MCNRVAVNGDARGGGDTVTVTPAAGTLHGWAYGPDSPTESSRVQVRGGSQVVGTYATTVVRADVNRAYRISGRHGFSVSFATTAGRPTYTVYTVNLGSAQARMFAVLSQGTRVVTVPVAPLRGH